MSRPISSVLSVPFQLKGCARSLTRELGCTSFLLGSMRSFRRGCDMLPSAGPRSTNLMIQICEWRATLWTLGWRVCHRYSIMGCNCKFIILSLSDSIQTETNTRIIILTDFSFFRDGPTSLRTRSHGMPSRHSSPSVSMVAGLTMTLIRGCLTHLSIVSSQ